MSQALDNFTRGIKHLIQTAIDKAPFDKIYNGKITAKNNNIYTVLINGKEYDKTTAQTNIDLNVGDMVKVVFPQNNPSLRFILNISQNGSGEIGDGVLTITQNGVAKGTFSANATSNTTINLDAGGSGTIDHTQLTNRDAVNQHPMSAITGLENEFGMMLDAFEDVWHILDSKGTYSKPSGGIPYNDLSTAVQSSLDKADSALQEHQSLAAYRTSAAQDIIDNGKQPLITDLTTIRLNVNANTLARHSHDNKTILDSISAQKVQNWDNTIYIVDSDTINGWYYEKWSNGRLICSRILSTNTLQVSTAWGSVFTGSWMNVAENKSGRRYPIPFIEQPIITASPIPTVNGGNFWIATNHENDSGSDGDGYTMSYLTHAPAYQCVRGSNGTITNPKIAIRAEGQWK